MHGRQDYLFRRKVIVRTEYFIRYKLTQNGPVEIKVPKKEAVRQVKEMLKEDKKRGLVY